MINLANVKRIDPEAGFGFGTQFNKIKFDSFELSLAEVEIKMPVNYSDLSEEKREKFVEEADKKVKEANSKKISVIRDFLKSDSTYTHF